MREAKHKIEMKQDQYDTEKKLNRVNMKEMLKYWHWIWVVGCGGFFFQLAQNFGFLFSFLNNEYSMTICDFDDSNSNTTLPFGKYLKISGR